MKKTNIPKPEDSSRFAPATLLGVNPRWIPNLDLLEIGFQPSSKPIKNACAESSSSPLSTGGKAHPLWKYLALSASPSFAARFSSRIAVRIDAIKSGVRILLDLVCSYIRKRPMTPNDQAHLPAQTGGEQKEKGIK